MKSELIDTIEDGDGEEKKVVVKKKPELIKFKRGSVTAYRYDNMEEELKKEGWNKV